MATCFHSCAFSRLATHRGFLVTNIKPKPTQKEGGAGHQLHLSSNAYRLKHNHLWSRGFSLGVDLGDAKTGVAVSKGYAPRPISVLQLRGQKLECRLIDLAEKEEADEFVIGLPKSCDGKETAQSNKVRSFAGRLAVRAAERGWRVYLQNEHGTSEDALDLMIAIWVRQHLFSMAIARISELSSQQTSFLVGFSSNAYLRNSSGIFQRLQEACSSRKTRCIRCCGVIAKLFCLGWM